MTAAEPDTRSAANLLHSKGFALCKPDSGTKKPEYPGWSANPLDPSAFGPDDQVGYLGGALSDGNRPDHSAVILDLDTADALARADEHLPPTGMAEGRISKRRSHRTFLVPNNTIPEWARSTAEQAAPAAVRKTGHPGPFKKQFRRRGTRKVVLDFIGTGGQAVGPPSLHSESGERREWEGGEPGEPAVIEFPDLWERTCRLADACGCDPPSGLSWPWELPPENGRWKPRASGAAGPDVHARAVAYVVRCSEAVSGCGGHDQTFAVARAVVWGFDLGEEAGFRVLLDHYNPRCAPPWSEAELRHKCRDADRLPFDKPRGYLKDTPPMNGTHHTAGGANSRDFRAEDVNDGPGWGAPEPLPEMPPVEPFPLDVFPGPLADYWHAAAESLKSPVDYVAVPALPVLGAAAGRAVAASVKRTYAEPPLLWCVLVAPPGRAKSPALRFAKGPVAGHTRTWREKHETATAAYEAEAAKYDKAFKEWAKRAEGDPPRKPVRPVLRQLALDNATTEYLLRANHNNPRGVVLVKDELADLVTALNQYKAGKGNDKQVLLSMWAGAEAEVCRVKDQAAGALPLHVEHTFVGVAGMIQPDLLGLLRGDFGRREFVNDGWADRFLMAFPDPPPLAGETWATVPEHLERGYADVVGKLLDLEMVEDRTPEGQAYRRPFYANFDAGAQGQWQAFTDAIAAAANRLDPLDNYVGVLSKLRHYGLRLTALLHVLRLACGEVSDTAPIDADTVRRAGQLVDYFESHGRRCLGIGWADQRSRVAGRVLRWLARPPHREAFSRSDVYLAVKDRRDVRRSEDLDPALRMLVDHNYLRPADPTARSKPGPAPEVYRVHPGWGRDDMKHGPKVPKDGRPSE